ncbi:DUF2242 domain-containing protein [Paraburkholderia acidipaludis]|uniref:DUF2242 domain-containing protein n=1 Tax=Paraburkholderia acidipaludis TaxID=660537 RepID=UPI001FE14B9B|nr:DUF2242 domain-containing protein [Paraburkholderia acidipaludis]
MSAPNMSRFPNVVPTLFSPLVAACAAAVLTLGACSSSQPKFQEDQLLSTAPNQFSRSFAYSSTDACESARRALLSQGYMTTMPHNDTVDASKDFQPAADSHIVVEVHVVCTPGDSTNASMVYVNAVQSGYALKKSDTSASVGLSILGSVSLPIRSNSDSMVKISSETIQSGAFYDRFFDMVGRYLASAVRSEPVPGNDGIKITPLAPVATPVTATAPAPVPAPANIGAAHPAASPAATPTPPAAQAAQTGVVHTGAATGVALPVPVAPAPASGAAAVPAAAPAAAASSAAMTGDTAPAQAAAEPPLLASGTTTLAAAGVPATADAAQETPANTTPAAATPASATNAAESAATAPAAPAAP